MTANIAGDDEMGGNRVGIVVEGELMKTPTRLRVRGEVVLRESRGDRTAFRKTFDQHVFDASRHGDCEIESVQFQEENFRYLSPDVEFGRITANSRKDDHQFRSYSPARRGAGPQLFSSAKCRVDTRGRDRGRVGCNEVRVRPLLVKLRPRTQACSRYQLKLPGRDHRSYANRGFEDVYPVRRISGDDEMGRNDSDLTVKTSLSVQGGRVVLDNSVRISERGGDRSTYAGSSRKTLFDVSKDAPGCKIVGLSGPKSGERRVRRRGGNRKAFVGTGADGLLKGAMCRVDTNGKDDDKLGCTRFEYSTQFHTVTLAPR